MSVFGTAAPDGRDVYGKRANLARIAAKVGGVGKSRLAVVDMYRLPGQIAEVILDEPTVIPRATRSTSMQYAQRGR